MLIKPFLADDVEAVKKFTDAEIGEGYYSLEELQQNQARSVATNGSVSSFLLIDDTTNAVKGLRLAFPPGSWKHGKGVKQRADLWPASVTRSAYFQSLFLAKEIQGKGWGPKLSEKSLQVFRQLGAAGVVTHSWKESPNNSSVRYLEKVGFKKIIEHPLYWFEVDYVCTRDGKPCRCTAVEMYLTL